MSEYIIGYDIGGTKCAVILANVSDGIAIVDKVKFSTKEFDGYSQTKEKLFELTRDMMARYNLSPASITAFGISCGGPVDTRAGRVLSPPNLNGWDDIPFTEEITAEFGVPAFLQNDANTGALVEWLLGAGRGTSNMIFITMGTGFGAGIIAEGKLLVGANSMGGEIGHIRLADDGPVGFGKAGSIEGFCSGGGIGRQAVAYTKKAIAEGNAPRWTLDGVDEAEISAKLIAEYARKGDADAVKIYDTVGENVGKAVSILIDAFNPERVVIGSVFARDEALLRAGMESVIEKEALIHSRKVCKVVAAETGDAIGDYASIIAACYELGIDPVKPGLPTTEGVLKHYFRLFGRHPELLPMKEKIMQAYITLRTVYEKGGKVLVCGNGGSAADADHIVGELMKGFYLKRPLDQATMKRLSPVSDFASKLQTPLTAIALTQHSALSTAFANDVDPALIFAQQVLGYGKSGDALIAISTSGNAENVNNAARLAKTLGLKVVALTGEGGGLLSNNSHLCLNVPAAVTAEVQELHLPIYHTLCAMLEAGFYSA